MIEETTITSLEEYARLVAKRADAGKPCWFRGVRDASGHDLTPSLFRHRKPRTAEEFRDLESQLMALFRDRAPPFHERIPQDAMELLFFMQHHGVPTRLLDLSENPYIALFFALEVALWERDVEVVDSAVWIVDPIELNKAAFQNNEGNDKILSAKDDLLNAYQPNSPTRTSGKSPVGIFGVHNSRRIVAQRGVFLLFGSNTVAMNKDASLADKDGLMQKVTIRKDKKKEIAKALMNMGVTDSVVYPDLDGLGREMKSRFEFWSGL